MTAGLVVAKSQGVIRLDEPLRPLDNLGGKWPKSAVRAKQPLRLPADSSYSGNVVCMTRKA